MGYETVLLDMDGTLVGVDVKEFVPAYFQMLHRWLDRCGVNTPVIPHLRRATEAMLQSEDGLRTNQEVFNQVFFSSEYDFDEEEMLKLFDMFYNSQFKKLRHLVEPIQGACEVVDELIEMGCTLVLATNPVFPRDAIVQRLTWGGLCPHQFELITSYENSHFCKPSPLYYQEIVDKVSADPVKTLMVGNDPLEDLCAEEVGMDTYLVNHFVVERSDVEYKPSYSGRLEQVLSVIREDEEAV